MKIIVALVIIFALFANVMPVFAAEVKIFQQASDSFSGISRKMPQEKNPAAWTVIFQKAKDNIETWDNTLSSSKSSSLRGNTEEIARRRGIK